MLMVLKAESLLSPSLHLGRADFFFFFSRGNAFVPASAAQLHCDEEIAMQFTLSVIRDALR